MFMGWEFAKCAHPSSSDKAEVNLSDGSIPALSLLYCSVVRRSTVPGRCGVDAKYFKLRLNADSAVERAK